jgi:hypothetical protein
MESSNYFVIAVISLFFAAFVGAVGFYVFKNCKEGFGMMDKLISDLEQKAKEDADKKAAANKGSGRILQEGFAAPAHGAGVPDCMQTCADAAALYHMLDRPSNTEEGPEDLRELKAILSKISCFKRDLMGTAGLVDATRYQPFATSHDMEPVAETTARCFAKTIPQRDLSLSLDKWGSRGTFLIKRLCTSEQLTEDDEHKAIELFGGAMGDITHLALGKCCNSDVGVIAGQPQPRMVGGYESQSIQNLKQYSGYY